MSEEDNFEPHSGSEFDHAVWLEFLRTHPNARDILRKMRDDENELTPEDHHRRLQMANQAVPVEMESTVPLIDLLTQPYVEPSPDRKADLKPKVSYLHDKDKDSPPIQQPDARSFDDILFEKPEPAWWSKSENPTSTTVDVHPFWEFIKGAEQFWKHDAWEFVRNTRERLHAAAHGQPYEHEAGEYEAWWRVVELSARINFLFWRALGVFIAWNRAVTIPKLIALGEWAGQTAGEAEERTRVEMDPRRAKRSRRIRDRKESWPQSRKHLKKRPGLGDGLPLLVIASVAVSALAPLTGLPKHFTPDLGSALQHYNVSYVGISVVWLFLLLIGVTVLHYSVRVRQYRVAYLHHLGKRVMPLGRIVFVVLLLVVADRIAPLFIGNLIPTLYGIIVTAVDNTVG